MDLLNRLDYWTRPGLTPEQFNSLIAQCRQCGLVTTRRVFDIHECVRRDEWATDDEGSDKH